MTALAKVYQVGQPGSFPAGAGCEKEKRVWGARSDCVLGCLPTACFCLLWCAVVWCGWDRGDVLSTPASGFPSRRRVEFSLFSSSLGTGIGEDSKCATACGFDFLGSRRAASESVLCEGFVAAVCLSLVEASPPSPSPVAVCPHILDATLFWQRHVAGRLTTLNQPRSAIQRPPSRRGDLPRHGGRGRFVIRFSRGRAVFGETQGCMWRDLVCRAAQVR